MKLIHSGLFTQMIQMGAQNLANYKETINKLNVFPVPDGDTGSNMNLSMQSGVKAIQGLEEAALPAILKAFVDGLLMGARGNSGVILSQLFKGFSDALQGNTIIDNQDLADALINGVKVAYQAVTNPVEGTILTVAKDVANRAKEIAQSEDDIIILMKGIVEEANEALARTPDQLPVLKDVGVVDSGGKGLVVIYEGFFAAMTDQSLPKVTESFDEQIAMEHDKSVQAFVDPATIAFGYCTEFFIDINANSPANLAFQEDTLRNHLGQFGDSLLVAASDNVVKVHIHTEQPGQVLEYAQQYGELHKIDIENMRKQHELIVGNKKDESLSMPRDRAVIAVAHGNGIRNMFLSIGATNIIEGGQTMNPSTGDFLLAIEQANARKIFILPNNKNILMAAKQAGEMAEKTVVVLPSKSIPQGIAALFAFDADHSMEMNREKMTAAMQGIKTGLVTYATKDAVINNLLIQKNAFIGMDDETIVATDENKIKTVQLLLNQLIDQDDEILTVFFGADVTEEEKSGLQTYVRETFTDIEAEYHVGDQTMYPFIFMVE